MVNVYNSKVSSTKDYLEYLYNSSFNRSKYLGDEEVIKVCDKVGVFKLKGYVKEINQQVIKNIDELLAIYLFDRYFSKIIFDLSSRIEFKLKSVLINECYKRTNNNFFYLIKKNHKWDNYSIDIATIKNWEAHTFEMSEREAYSHYILYYLQNFDFISNKNKYLQNISLIDIDDSKYNYPPFKYLIESATLGCVISFIRSLRIGSTDIYAKTASNFGLGNNNKFLNYLKRLNEIRNRVAHGGRIFNRTFRSATGVGRYQILRKKINNHKSLDVYLFLFFMLNELDEYKDFESFKNVQIRKLFEEFKKDYISNNESFGLIKAIKKRV